MKNERNAICKVIYENIKNKTCVNADAMFCDMFLVFIRGEDKNDPFFHYRNRFEFFVHGKMNRWTR